jgi:hypothetical protein
LYDGPRPDLFVVDHNGTVRFDSIVTQPWQIPSIENILKVLARPAG